MGVPLWLGYGVYRGLRRSNRGRRRRGTAHLAVHIQLHNIKKGGNEAALRHSRRADLHAHHSPDQTEHRLNPPNSRRGGGKGGGRGTSQLRSCSYAYYTNNIGQKNDTTIRLPFPTKHVSHHTGQKVVQIQTTPALPPPSHPSLHHRTQTTYSRKYTNLSWSS